MKIQKFVRKPFEVEGVRVTEQNMSEVAAWCKGKVVTNEKSGTRHIHLEVHRPLTERQTMGFAGDWILFANRGFKIYTQNAFSRNFEVVEAGIGSDHADFELKTEVTEDDINQLALKFNGIYPSPAVLAKEVRPTFGPAPTTPEGLTEDGGYPVTLPISSDAVEMARTDDPI